MTSGFGPILAEFDEILPDLDFGLFSDTKIFFPGKWILHWCLGLNCGLFGLKLTSVLS